LPARWVKNGRIAAATALILGLLDAGCGVARKLERQSPVQAASGGAEPARASFFAVTQEQMGHLTVVPAKRTNWAIHIHTTGTVDFDNDHTTQAITQVGGPITRILVDLGTHVREGDPLLYVSSPDVANAISTYKKARNRQDLTRRIMQRTKDLLDRGAAASKDYESSQADYNDATTDVQNSLQPLRIFGITKDEIDTAERQGVAISPELAVRAPITGTVVQKLVLPGQLIQAGQTNCFVISDLSKVWVQGHIFDHDLPAVHVGDPVEATDPSFPRKFHGVVTYVGAMVDPATRTTSVRIVTDNPGDLLKKDMFLDAEILSRTARNLVTVPVSAVLRDEQNEPYVYVEVQPGRFAQRQVTIGAQQDDSIEVVSGLSPGEKVVAEGSIFLQFATSYQ
jgi:membrane fusion protein, heavy metal efflux system